jgi:hypothetical protein
MISLIAGLFPYISMYTLNSRAVRSNPPIMDKINTTIPTAICQAGTALKPNLKITMTGAEKGKMEKMTQIGLLGKFIIKLKNQKGA